MSSSAASGRRRIFEAAVAVFAERGYSRAHVREVAKLAGIAPSTIYHHFRSKDRLYEHVLHTAANEFIGAITARIEALGPEAETHPDLALGAVVDATLTFARENPRLHRLAFAVQAGAGSPKVRRILQEEMGRIRDLVRSIYARHMAEDEAEVAEAVLSAQFAGWIQLGFNEPALLERPELRERILAIHKMGLDRTTVR